VLCTREYQTTIADSVHKLLKEQISLLRVSPWFHITDRNIRCTITGAEFIFKGLHANAEEIKSTEGIDICWIEEARTVSEASLRVLIPTIRNKGSEIWITFNQGEEDDPVYVRFVKNKRPGSIVQPVTWEDNPFFPAELDEERLYLKKHDPETYDHVWSLECRTITDAVIFKGRYVVEAFETPADARFFHGLDFGFSVDPMALTRSWIKDRHLFIDMESFGHGIEFPDMATFMGKVPTSDKWPIKADSARPETIHWLKSQHFDVTPAEKWPGSVEDGIAYLRGFEKIHIHQRCTHVAEEARLYRYKVDRITEEVLPIVVDAHNHGWDSVRYALDKYIKRKQPLVISQAVRERAKMPRAMARTMTSRFVRRRRGRL
jgi:phage terminase large subunit